MPSFEVGEGTMVQQKKLTLSAPITELPIPIPPSFLMYEDPPARNSYQISQELKQEEKALLAAKEVLNQKLENLKVRLSNLGKKKILLV
jgi:hypothetical protein